MPEEYTNIMWRDCVETWCDACVEHEYDYSSWQEAQEEWLWIADMMEMSEDEPTVSDAGLIQINEEDLPF